MVETPQLSFAQVYDAHGETVYRYVHRRCQDHSLAEDVTQDTFMTAIRSAKDPATITVGWLITVARNRLLDVLRRQTRYQEKLRLITAGLSQSSDIDVAERLRVEAALGLLPMHYRLVLALHYINGMTVQSIADELDRSLKAVEGLISRARKELAACLEETDPRPFDGGGS